MSSVNYPYKRIKADPEYLDELRQDIIQKHGSDDNTVINCVFHCALSQQRGPSSAMKFLRSIPESELGNFQIWVLKGGFSYWQSLYGTDDTVTENYKPDLWN